MPGLVPARITLRKAAAARHDEGVRQGQLRCDRDGFPLQGLLADLHQELIALTVFQAASSSGEKCLPQFAQRQIPLFISGQGDKHSAQALFAPVDSGRHDIAQRRSGYVLSVRADLDGPVISRIDHCGQNHIFLFENGDPQHISLPRPLRS